MPQRHAPDPLAQMSVPDLPLWTNKYAKTRADFGRFFALTRLMAEHGLTRLQAVEVQNHVRGMRCVPIRLRRRRTPLRRRCVG